MSHHNSTPQSILDAPQLTPVVILAMPQSRRPQRRRTVVRRSVPVSWVVRERRQREAEAKLAAAREAEAVRARIADMLSARPA